VPGVSEYNEAAGFYRQEKYAEAIPLFKKAIKRSSDKSISSEADQALLEAAKKINADATRYLAESQYQLGKAEAETSHMRNRLWKKAEPTLKDLFENTPKDKSDERRSLVAKLRDIANIKKDTKSAAAYKPSSTGRTAWTPDRPLRQ
jgi:tetratricopeptide (TPR) repeat protein